MEALLAAEATTEVNVNHFGFLWTPCCAQSVQHVAEGLPLHAVPFLASLLRAHDMKALALDRMCKVRNAWSPRHSYGIAAVSKNAKGASRPRTTLIGSVERTILLRTQVSYQLHTACIGCNN